MSKITKSARLIFVSVGTNNNKFYYLDLHDDDSVRIRYGRYIENDGGELQTQSDTSQPGGERLFNKKLNEKVNKGYKPQPVLDSNISTGAGVKNAGLEQLALEQIRTTSLEVKALISYLCAQNVHNITSNSAIKYNAATGLFSTASGLITQGGILDGRLLLSKIKDKVDAQGWGDTEYLDLVNQFLTIVPRDFGRTRPDPQSLFPDDDEIQKQLGILDSLEASLTTALAPPKNEGDKPAPLPPVFDTGLELLRDEAEFAAIKKHFETSAKTEHRTIAHLTLKNVYTVEIGNMKRNYEERGKVKGNIHRLWHGTSSANVLSIFKSGFMLTAALDGAHRGQSVWQRFVFRARLDQIAAIRQRFLGWQRRAAHLYVPQRCRGRQRFRAKNDHQQKPAARLRFVLGARRKIRLAHQRRSDRVRYGAGQPGLFAGIRVNVANKMEGLRLSSPTRHNSPLL